MAEVRSDVVRHARPEDVPEILELIRDLAEYEHSLGDVLTSASQLAAMLFGGTADLPGVLAPTPGGARAAYAHVVDHVSVGSDGSQQRLGGFALWFLNASTWTGTHGIYLEDLYVRPELRGSGYGKALMRALAQTCVDRGYRRFEWSVLDWNSPAIGFYRSIGAVGMDEWTVQRVTGQTLVDLADGRRHP